VIIDDVDNAHAAPEDLIDFPAVPDFVTDLPVGCHLEHRPQLKNSLPDQSGIIFSVKGFHQPPVALTSSIILSTWSIVASATCSER
jgi:hypothetical protein